MSIDTFFLFYVYSIVRNDSVARKQKHRLHTRNSTTATKKRKDISCYILEIVQLIPLLKKNSSCYVLETLELIPE